MREIANSSNTKSKRKPTEKLAFDAQTFLDSAGVARKVKEFKMAAGIYAQGDAASSVMYLQSGGVKLTVVNEVGKEAVVAILRPGDFFGEGSLAGQPVRMGTATAITLATVLVIQKNEMFKVLHAEHGLSDLFIKFMLARNIRIEADLVDQLFNSSEKRLARTLLLLARYGKQDQAHGVLPQDVARNAGRDDWHNALKGQFFYEQVQEIGLHQVQRRSSDQYFSFECDTSRVGKLSPMIGNATPAGIPNVAGLDFVLVELDLGATFCELALSTKNEGNKERNTRNAQKAYDSALHFLQSLSPDSTEQVLINEKFLRLNDLLERLGVSTR